MVRSEMMRNIKISGFADEISPRLVDQIKAFQKLDLNYIDIRGVDGTSITNKTLEEVTEIKKHLNENNIKVACLGSPIGKIFITEPYKEHLELFKHTLEIAKVLDTKYVRIFSYYIPNQAYAKYRDEVIKRLECMVKLAEEQDIILLHENEKDIYGDSPERCVELFEYFQSPNFRAVFDFANFVQCGYNPLDAYPVVKPYLEYFHIKDALFSTKEVVAPGLGDGKVAEILTLALNEGYDGFFALEPHLGNFVGRNALELETNNMEEDNATDGYFNFLYALTQFKKIIDNI